MFSLDQHSAATLRGDKVSLLNYTFPRKPMKKIKCHLQSLG